MFMGGASQLLIRQTLKKQGGGEFPAQLCIFHKFNMPKFMCFSFEFPNLDTDAIGIVFPSELQVSPSKKPFSNDLFAKTMYLYVLCISKIVTLFDGHPAEALPRVLL